MFNVSVYPEDTFNEKPITLKFSYDGKSYEVASTLTSPDGGNHPVMVHATIKNIYLKNDINKEFIFIDCYGTDEGENSHLRIVSLDGNAEYMLSDIKHFSYISNEVFRINTDGSTTLNIRNGIGEGSFQQVADPSGNGVYIGEDGKEYYNLPTDIHPMFTEYKAGDAVPFGAIGHYAKAFTGKSSSQGKRSTSEGTSTIAIGDYSHAEGNTTIAEGGSAHSEGIITYAKGHASHAQGRGTYTEGNNSFASGLSVSAIGENSNAFGEGSIVVKEDGTLDTTNSKGIAVGKASTIVGTNNKAVGDASFAGGTGSEATKANSFAFGEGVKASGNASVAMGLSNTASATASFAGGTGSATATGANTFAFGNLAEATGDTAASFGRRSKSTGITSFVSGTDSEASNHASVAMGNNNTSSGNSSIALGSNNTASNFASVAAGQKSEATGGTSIALGHTAKAEGYASVATGFKTTASGKHSHAQNNNTIASGENSSASGYGTIASAKNQFVVGKYNKEDEDALFIIGNGSSSTKRGNALLVKNDGVLEAGIISSQYTYSTFISSEDISSENISSKNISSNGKIISETLSGDNIEFIMTSNTNFKVKYDDIRCDVSTPGTDWTVMLSDVIHVYGVAGTYELDVSIPFLDYPGGFYDNKDYISVSVSVGRLYNAKYDSNTKCITGKLRLSKSDDNVVNIMIYRDISIEKWMAHNPDNEYDGYYEYYDLRLDNAVDISVDNLSLRECNTVSIGNNQYVYPNTTVIGCKQSSVSRKVLLGANGTAFTYMSIPGTTWTTGSDRRDKADFKAIDNSLDFINRLEPTTYVMNYRDDYILDDGTFDNDAYIRQTKKKHRRISGFIAQDVYQSMKDVYGDDNYANIVDYSKYDDENCIEDRYHMRYTQLIPFLTGAIQELSKEVDSLKATIAELKSQSTNQ